MITGGVPENDYSVPKLLGYNIRNIIYIDLTKINAYLVDKNWIFGGGGQNDYTFP